MALWVISGVAGSGKSSLAKALAASLACPMIDADDHHPPANKAKMSSGQPLDEGDRKPWLEGISKALEALDGGVAVLAFPGLRLAHRERIRLVRPDARFFWLDLGPCLAESRLKTRGGFFPPGLSVSQFAAVESESWDLVLDASWEPERLLKEALARIEEDGR